MRMFPSLISLLSIIIAASGSQSPQSQQPVGKVRISIFDTIDRIVPNITITIQGNGVIHKFTSGEKAYYEFDLAPGIYTVISDKGNGYYFPFRRSAFKIESETTTLINVLPINRVLTIGTVIGDRDVTQLAPEPKYESLKVTDTSTTEIGIVVQYDHKREQAKSIEYRDGARPFSGVVVTYGALTIIADVVSIDKVTLRVEAIGNVIVEDGKTRFQADRKVIEFRKGKAVLGDL